MEREKDSNPGYPKYWLGSLSEGVCNPQWQTQKEGPMTKYANAAVVTGTLVTR